MSGLINDTSLLSPCLAFSVSSFRAHLYVPISLASNRIQPHHPRQLWIKKVEDADKKSTIRIRFGRHIHISQIKLRKKRPQILIGLSVFMQQLLSLTEGQS